MHPTVKMSDILTPYAAQKDDDMESDHVQIISVNANEVKKKSLSSDNETGSSSSSGSFAKQMCHRCIKPFLMINSFVWSGAAVAAVSLLLNLAPFNQMVYAFFTFMTLFLISVIGLFVQLFYRSEKNLKKTMKSYECAFVSTLGVCVFICFCLTLVFIFPDSFMPTGNQTFQRIGGVTDTTARIMVRSPQIKEVFVEFRPLQTEQWSRSTTIQVSDKADFTAFIELTGLTPATEYEFRSSHLNETILSFKSFPSEGTPSQFRFYWGSCFQHMFPNFQHPPGFGYVKELKVDFINFLGDFIYADLPWYQGTHKDLFRGWYRQSFTNDHFLPTVENTPNFFMWDDHEFINDYSNGINTTLYEEGIQPWDEYLGRGNPSNYGQGKGFFSYDYGDSAFFMLDTRSYRDKNSLKQSAEKTMLGIEQKTKLFEWLLEKNSTSVFKFILSTVAVITSKKTKAESIGIATDDWRAFRHERDEILSFIRNNSISGVVFLTGDSHFLYSAELEYAGSGIFEFSSSPVSAFDDSLGGFFDKFPWNSENFTELDDVIRFWDIGERVGPISLIGIMEVKTDIPVPTITVTFHRNTEVVFTERLTIDQLRPRPRPS